MYILASSFAGPLAAMLAAEEPERVRGVIMCASFLRSPRRRLKRFKFAAVAPVVWTGRATRRIPLWTLRSRTDALRKAKAETWSRASARSIAARVRAIVDVDARDALSRCVQPMMCVHFAQDKVVTRRSAEEIVRHGAAIELITLPGDHLGMFTRPAPVAE